MTLDTGVIGMLEACSLWTLGAVSANFVQQAEEETFVYLVSNRPRF